MSPTAIADTIKMRTEALLRKTRTAVSSKPIVMRAEYAHCPNLTIINTRGLVLKVPGKSRHLDQQKWNC